MNLYLREMKAHRKSIIIWSISMIFLILAGIGAATGVGSFNDMMAEMPPSLQNLFGVGLFDLSKLVDYFGILYLYIALMATIHAVMIGNNIIAKEERDKTAEFLLVKPISRKKIITAKLSVALTMVIILNLVTWITTYAAFTEFSEGEQFTTAIFHLMVGLLGLQIVFLSLGALLAAWIGRYKLSSPIATGILMTMFLLSVMIDISGKIEYLRVFSFFKYFDAKDILKLGYNFTYLFIAAILTVLFAFGSYYFYQKRDMRI
ncbi:MAG: ABC transporter permease subunit [Mobilitalea sp.]